MPTIASTTSTILVDDLSGAIEHPERFLNVQTFFLKHADQAWSFTDCLSFHVMKQARLRESLTKDTQFEQAGFVALLN